MRIMWGQTALRFAACSMLVTGFAPAAAYADPVSLVLAQRWARAVVPPATQQQTDADALSALVLAENASASAVLTSDISDLRHMSGSGVAAANTFGARFAEAPLSDALFTVVFQLASPQLFSLTGAYAPIAHTSGESGITTANALAQFGLGIYDPDTGVADGVIFNDVFSSHSSAAGVYGNSGLLQPGYYYVLVRGFAIGSEGVGTALAQTAFSFQFDLSDTDMAPTPEPATLALLGSGLVGLIGAHRRRRRTGKAEPAFREGA